MIHPVKFISQQHVSKWIKPLWDQSLSTTGFLYNRPLFGRMKGKEKGKKEERNILQLQRFSNRRLPVSISNRTTINAIIYCWTVFPSNFPKHFVPREKHQVQSFSQKESTRKKKRKIIQNIIQTSVPPESRAFSILDRCFPSQYSSCPLEINTLLFINCSTGIADVSIPNIYLTSYPFFSIQRIRGYSELKTSISQKNNNNLFLLPSSPSFTPTSLSASKSSQSLPHHRSIFVLPQRIGWANVTSGERAIVATLVTPEKGSISAKPPHIISFST